MTVTEQKIWEVFFDHKDKNSNKGHRIDPLILDLNKDGKFDITGANQEGNGKIDGPTVMLGDSMSVIMSTTIPSSMLKKKHLAIAYHKIRKNVATGIITFGHICSETNISDVCTKPLPNESFHNIFRPTLFRAPLTELSIPLPVGEIVTKEQETEGNNRENEEVKSD